MAAAKAFLLMFLFLVSLALIPYETAAARDLLEVKDKGFVTPGALAPNNAVPRTPRCRDVYCRGRSGPPRGP